MFPQKDLDLMKIGIERNKALIKIMTKQITELDNIRTELASELTKEEMLEICNAIHNSVKICDNLVKQSKSREHLILLNSKWST